MGAHPKNKITRAERGKRRAGNTPSLKKDHKVASVPLYKRGLLNNMLASLGVVTADPQTKKTEHKKTGSVQSVKPIEPAKKPTRVASQATPKAAVQRTQHKG